MNLFISQAFAETAANTAARPQSLNGSLFMLIGFLLIFYFLMWRPQSKRAKQHRELLSKLAKGDEVVTSSGLLGRVAEVTDEFVVLEIASGVQVTLQKPAVSTVLPKGTIKSFK